jgi:hypothetical protein
MGKCEYDFDGKCEETGYCNDRCMSNTGIEELKLTDLALENMLYLVGEVQKESKRQIEKWGYQTKYPYEWEGWIRDKVEELAHAMSNNSYYDGKCADVEKKAIQVATLALKIAEMYGKMK